MEAVTVYTDANGWNESEYEYNGHKILIKSREGDGIRCHVFCPNSTTSVQFSLKYNFMPPSKLLEKAKLKIDQNYDPKNKLSSI